MAEYDDDFAAFMAGRWPSLRRYAYLLTGDLGQAEDLAQAALLKTYGAWPRIRAGGAVESYTRTCLTRLFLSERRRRQPATVSLGPQHDRDRADEAGREERMVLWQQVGLLPPRQRAVVVLRYYEDLTEEQIADVLRCSRGTVKSQCSKALSRLRADLPTDLTRG